MKRQQLYIEGVAVDMPNEEIKIKVESNIFSDASKIMTAHSYSITLPRTMTNDSIFAQAYIPAAVTGGKSTHCYLSCALHIDSVPLFTDGRCVLSEVDEDGYKCNLYWGLLNIFDEIKNEGLDLCDLPLSSRWVESTMADTWIPVTKYMGYTNNVMGMNNDIYSTLDTDSRADRLPWSMPAKSATDVLNKIVQVYGLTTDISYAAAQRIAQIYHPLITRKAMSDGETCKIRLGTVTINPSTNVYYPQIYQPTTDWTGQFVYATWSDLILGNAMATSQPMANDVLDFTGSGVSLQVLAAAKCAIKSIRVYGKCDKYFEAFCGLEDVTADQQQISHLSGGYYTIDYTWKDLTAEKGDSVIAIGAGSGAWWTSAPSTLDVHFDFEVEKIEDLEIGTWWNWVRNLPEIGVIDYLNELLAHIGGCIVGSVTKPSALRIMTYDEVLQSTMQNIDTLGVKSITMAFDDLAQKNLYTHEENDDTGITYTGDGVIYTSDPTLELENDAFSSKFKVPRLALIRLWEVEKNENANTYKASWVASGNYICGYDSDNTNLMNTGQDFATTISNYYVDYEAVMTRPKVIEAIVRFSVFELLALDLGKRVHIARLNRSYAIKTIQSDSGDKYKLTLVQI